MPLSHMSIRFPNFKANMTFQQKVQLQYLTPNDRPFNCLDISRVVLYIPYDRDSLDPPVPVCAISGASQPLGERSDHVFEGVIYNRKSFVLLHIL